MWAQLVSAGIGVWLMAAPTVLDYSSTAAVLARIVGPTAAAVSIIALWEASRGARWLNFVLGAALVASAVVLGHGIGGRLNDLAAGVALALLTLVKKEPEHRIGGGWRALWR